MPGHLSQVAVLASLLLACACGDSRMRTLPELDDEANLEDARLEPCEIETLDGPVDGLCGTLVVPEREGGDAVLSLPIERIKGQAPGAEALPVVFMGNGPGQSNFTFLPPRELTQGNDFLRIGYRGADSSVTLECNEVASVIRETPALTETHLDQVRGAANDCLERLSQGGHRLDDFGLDDVAKDLARALELLEYGRIHILADGFGLQVALAFAEAHPGRVERIVVTSPAPLGPFLLEPRTVSAHLEALAGRCAHSDVCRSDDLLDDIESVRDDPPSRWGFTEIDSGRLTLVTVLSLLGRESAARAVDAWAGAGDGSAAGLAMMSWLGDSIGQNLFIWGDALAKTVPLAYDPDADYRAENARGPDHLFGSPARLLLYGALPDAQWLPRTETPSPVQALEPSDPEAGPPSVQPATEKPRALFVHGTLDPTSAIARPAFAARLAAVDTTTFEESILASEAWAHRPNEMARLASDFFNEGRVGTLTKQPWSFSPSLRLATMQWVMTVLTIVVPLLLFGFVYLLVRRVKRTIEQERLEQALGPSSD